MEAGLVLLVVILMLWLGLVFVGRSLRHRRAERLGTELQTLANAFQDYRRQHGAWPPSTYGEVIVPRGMEKILQETSWAKGSPVGGTFGWLAPAPPGRAGAIWVNAFSPALPLELTRAELLELDREIDDGDPATGRLRAGFNGWPVYVVEFKP